MRSFFVCHHLLIFCACACACTCLLGQPLTSGLCLAGKVVSGWLAENDPLVALPNHAEGILKCMFCLAKSCLIESLACLFCMPDLVFISPLLFSNHCRQQTTIDCAGGRNGGPHSHRHRARTHPVRLAKNNDKTVLILSQNPSLTLSCYGPKLVKSTSAGDIVCHDEAVPALALRVRCVGLERFRPSSFLPVLLRYRPSFPLARLSVLHPDQPPLNLVPLLLFSLSFSIHAAAKSLSSSPWCR